MPATTTAPTTAPTPSSRAAAGAVATLAMVHLVTAVTTGVLPAYARVILLATCVVTAVAAMVLLKRSSFFSRLAVAAVASLTASGAVLVGVVGLPGGDPPGLVGTEAFVVALALLAGMLLVLDVRLRGASTSDRPPYAL